MSSKKLLSATKVIANAKAALKIKKDGELAELLGLSHATIASWKIRENIDLKKIVTLCNNVSADWLLYGEGTPDGKPKPEFDPQDESRRLDQMILEVIRDMDLEKKRYIAEYVEREKFFWEFKKKNAGIDDNGTMRKAG